MKFLFLFFLFACSIGRFFIGSLDTYVTSKTADRLQLYTKQETALGLDIEHLFNQVKPQIKIIEQNIKTLRAKKEIVLDKKLVDSSISEFVIIYNLGVELVNKYNQQMTEKQYGLFMKDYQKKLEKKQKKHSLKRYKKMVPEKFEEIFGELSEEQIKLLKNNAKVFLNWSKRRFLQEDVHYKSLVVAQGKADLKERNDLVDKAYQSLQRSADEDFKNHLGSVIEVIDQFLKTLNQSQRRELNEKVDLALGIMEAFIKHQY